MCFLAFSHHTNTTFFPKPPTGFLTCFIRGQRQKYARKEVHINRVWNSQPPGHESDTLTTEPPRRRNMCLKIRKTFCEKQKCWFSSLFPQNVISSKLKESADDNFKFDQNGRKLSKQVEKHCGKRRNCS